MSTKKYYLLATIFSIIGVTVLTCFFIYLQPQKYFSIGGPNTLPVFIIFWIICSPASAVMMIYKYSYKSKVYNIFDLIKTRNEKSRIKKLSFFVSGSFQESENFNKLLNLTDPFVSGIIKINSESKEVKIAKVTLQDNREYILTFINNVGKNYTKGKIVGFVLDKIDGLGF